MRPPERRPSSKAQRPASPAPASGATAGVDLGGFDSYVSHHRRVARDSLLRMLRAPWASLLTWAVIAIALALPATLFLLLANVEQLSQSWTSTPSITLYLDMKVDDRQAYQVQQSIRNKPQVADVRYISPAQAIEEFKEYSGLAEAIAYLDENPLPPVLIVTPVATLTSASEVEKLLNELKLIPVVERAQLD